MSKNQLKLNWKYALGEITLIFIGISLAMAFDNWSQNQQKNKTQTILLEEIRTDLYQDTTVINRVLRVTRAHITGVEKIVAYLESGEPYTEDVGFHLAKALTFPRAPFISAGYQTLKSTDITLIKDRKIRRPIVEYYEFMHPYLDQLMADVEFEFKSYWVPWILENISDFQYSNMAVPVDYEAMVNDPLLARNFKISKDNNLGLLNFLVRAKTDSHALIDRINEQLGDLP